MTDLPNRPERLTACQRVYMTPADQSELVQMATAEGMSASEFGRVAIRYIIQMVKIEGKVKKQ